MIIKQLNNKIFIIICLLMLYMFLGNMTSVCNINLPFHQYILIIITFMTLIGIVNLLKLNSTNYSSFLLLCIMLLFLIIVPTFLFIYNKRWSLEYSIVQFFSSFLWVLFIIYFYMLSKNNIEVLKYLKRIIYVLPIFLLIYINIKIISNNTGIPQISSVYYLIFMIPLLMLNKNKFVKIVGITIIIFALLLAQKRTGLLTLITFFITYYIFMSKLNNKSNWDTIKTIIIFIFTLCVSYLIINFISKYINIEILNKMMNIEEDGGSGRMNLWMQVINALKNSNIITLIFGHGFNSVYYEIGMHLSAHNDFLEIIYDYGILGLFIYLIIFMQLISKGKRLLKNKNPIAPSFIASLFSAIIFSISSDLVIYPTYFLIFCCIWGYCMGISEERKKSFEKSKYNSTNI